MLNYIKGVYIRMLKPHGWRIVERKIMLKNTQLDIFKMEAELIHESNSKRSVYNNAKQEYRVGKQNKAL